MKPKLVLDMNDPRPVWSRPGWVQDELRSALPPAWEMVVVESMTDGTGDGQERASREALDAVPGASVYLGFGVPAELLRAGPDLVWIHSGAAGVGGSLTPELRRADAIFTNSAGIHGPPVAETVLAMILHFARGLDFAVSNQARSSWDKDPWYRPGSPVRELASATVGVLGYGGVGRDIGRRALALGARVLGLTRTPPDAGSDAGAEILRGDDGLARLLAESDFLVVCAPETEATRRIIDGAALAAMKPDAVLINAARGGLVDHDALIEALANGEVRGAGLDVFSEEPLAASDPLWQMPNVLITPHVSAVTPGFWRRQADLILENLRRLLAGEALLNVVDLDAGY